MRRAAKVTSVDALGRFKGALAQFHEESVRALGEANSDILRTVQWLKHDARRYWEQQIKVRTRKVAEAKSELYRAQLSSRDERPSTAIERKNLVKAERRLQEAEDKVQRVRKWAGKLEREQMLYKGQVQPLGNLVNAEMPRALARLDNLRDRLDDYLATAPAPARTADGTASAAPADTASSGGAGRNRAEDDAEQSPWEKLRRHVPTQIERDAMDDAPADDRGADTAPAPRPTMVNLLELTPDPPATDARVVVGRSSLDEPRVFLHRLTFTSEGDCGWYVGPADDPETVDERTAMTVGALLAARPTLAEAVCFPRGYLVMVDAGRITAVVDSRGRTAWQEADA